MVQLGAHLIEKNKEGWWIDGLRQLPLPTMPRRSEAYQATLDRF